MISISKHPREGQPSHLTTYNIMAQEYFITLLDEMLEPVEGFDIAITSDIEDAKNQAAAYMTDHNMPVGTLTFDHPVTLEPIRDSIDIVFSDNGIVFNDYQK